MTSYLRGTSPSTLEHTRPSQWPQPTFPTMLQLTSPVRGTNSSTLERTRASQWLLAPAPQLFSNSPPARSLHPKCSLCAHTRKSTTEAKVKRPNVNISAESRPKVKTPTKRQQLYESQHSRRKSTHHRNQHPSRKSTESQYPTKSEHLRQSAAPQLLAVLNTRNWSGHCKYVNALPSDTRST